MCCPGTDIRSSGGNKARTTATATTTAVQPATATTTPSPEMTSAASTSAARVQAGGVATDTARARFAPGRSGCPTSEKRSAPAAGTTTKCRSSASSGLTRIAAISSSTARKHGPSASTPGDHQRCHPGQNSRCAAASTARRNRTVVSGATSIIG